MAQPHRSWLAEDKRKDHRAETQIGRLLLAGRISEPKYWAAERWRSIVRQFHLVMATPVQAGSTLGGMVSSGNDQDVAGDVMAAERPESDEEKRKRVLAQHGRAMSAMRALPGCAQIFATMERVIIHDHACVEADVPRLVSGLEALCSLWKMPDPEPNAELPVRVTAVRGERQAWNRTEIGVIYVRGDD